MKLLIGLVLVGFVSANIRQFFGSWEEQPGLRENLNDYLWARDLNWFKRVYVTSKNFKLSMHINPISGDPNADLRVHGKKGPSAEEYAFVLKLDNSTRTRADLGALGGPRDATAELKDGGNTMITYLHVPGTNNIDCVAIRTLDRNNPNRMVYTLRDSTYPQYPLVQHMKRVPVSGVVQG